METNKDVIIKDLRNLMKDSGVDYYICGSEDPHCSEYVNEHFKIRQFLTGFTGSNGTLVISKDYAGLWTDGRYYVQAAGQLPAIVEVVKAGQPGVPTIKKYLSDNLKTGQIIGLNGFLTDALFYDDIRKVADEKGCSINTCFRPEDKLWTDRPGDSASAAFILSEEYTGESVKEKIKRVREYLSGRNADALFIGCLDDQMWLYNIRGNDIECNPVIYGYTFMTSDQCVFFAKEESVQGEVKEYLEKNDVIVKPYENAFDFMKSYTDSDKDSVILCDKRKLSAAFYELINNTDNPIYALLPTEIFKAVKNETEIKNLKEAYLKDSVVVTKYIKYIIDNAGKGITEMEGARVIDSMRADIEGFIELSFPTISAYGPNGAMMHYEPSDDNPVLIDKDSFYLVDSGGQYMKGTTDVTRTVCTGEPSDEMKQDYTLSACAMLRLQNTVFMDGCTGRNLDIMARSVLWRYGMDYKCGTGHGVGHVLNVHEGPVNISWQKRAGGIEEPLKPGNTISDEPGVYKEGKYGIRIENILLCDEAFKNEDGRFLCFKPLTLAPLDSKSMDKNYMSDEDIDNYNRYQELVFYKISPFLNKEETEWLKNETKPL